MLHVFRSFLLGLLLWSACLSAQSLYFPPNTGTWDTLPADSLGWCQSRLDSLYDFLDARGTKAFLVLKGGRLVEEWYFDSFTQDSLWYWASAGKTLTATLVGIAQQEGLLDIDDPTADYLGPGWTSCDSAAEAEITLWHQLTMTTGLDESVADVDCTDDSCLQCLTEPGTRWFYHNAPYTLLTRVIEQAAGVSSVNQYFLSRIGLNIGMSGAYLNLGYNRVFVSTARSFARFGLLMLAQGQWNGTPILSDTAYYRAMTTPSQSLNPSYGYLWWLNGQGSHRLPVSTLSFNGSLIPTAPEDMIAGLGANDQKLYLVPSQDLVIIRMGNAASQLQPSLSGFDADLWERLSNLVCEDSATTALASSPIIDVEVFPNPTHDLIRVSSPQPIAALTLYDLQGRRLLRVTSDRLDLSDLPAGTYLLHWQTQQGQQGRERVVKLA